MPDQNLKNTVQNQRVAAMKTGQKERTHVLRMLLSEIKRKAVDDPAANPQEAVSAYAKTLRQAMADMEKHSQTQPVAQLQAELHIVDEFLPRQIDAARLTRMADQALTPRLPLAPKDTGRALGALMKAVAAAGASADAGKVRTLVESKIHQ